MEHYFVLGSPASEKSPGIPFRELTSGAKGSRQYEIGARKNVVLHKETAFHPWWTSSLKSRFRTPSDYQVYPSDPQPFQHGSGVSGATLPSAQKDCRQ